MKQIGKKAIGDGIYRGNQDTVSFPNTHDSRSVKKFKSRALKRHESFNGMTKSFQILRQMFRHKLSKIGIAFEAVAVICQYKVEREEPMYDVLVEDVLNGNEEDSDSEIEDIIDIKNDDEDDYDYDADDKSDNDEGKEAYAGADDDESDHDKGKDDDDDY